MVQSVERISLRTDDFDALCEAADGWDQRYLQMSDGRFEGSIDLTQVGTTQIMRERWGRKIRFQGTAPPGGFGFGLPLDIKGTGSLLGSRVDLDTVIMVAPNKEGDFIAPEYWDSIVLGVSEEDVLSIVTALSEQVDFAYGSHGSFKMDPNVAAALREFGRAFLQRSQTAASKEDDALVARWSEQFTRLFLWEILNARQRSNGVAAPANAAKIVRNASDLVLADPTTNVGLTEICSALGVGLRTLHNAFGDVAGMSPATWLRRLRLNQAHKTLLKSSPDNTLVKQIAVDHGYLHFGHFTEQYRKLFGQLPSETLQLM